MTCLSLQVSLRNISKLRLALGVFASSQTMIHVWLENFVPLLIIGLAYKLQNTERKNTLYQRKKEKKFQNITLGLCIKGFLYIFLEYVNRF